MPPMILSSIPSRYFLQYHQLSLHSTPPTLPTLAQQLHHPRWHVNLTRHRVTHGSTPPTLPKLARYRRHSR